MFSHNARTVLLALMMSLGFLGTSVANARNIEPLTAVFAMNKSEIINAVYGAIRDREKTEGLKIIVQLLTTSGTAILCDNSEMRINSKVLLLNNAILSSGLNKSDNLLSPVQIINISAPNTVEICAHIGIAW